MALQLQDAGVRDQFGWRLHPVSLCLRPGRLHVVLGPNGAGKSTLLSLMAGDLKPAAGSVILDGKALQEWSPQRLARRRAVYSQNEQMHFAFTALEAVQLGGLPWAIPEDTSRRLACRALEWVEADVVSHKSVLSLSGGQQARLRLARALVQLWAAPEGEPCYLLLDEPTAHLDFGFQQKIFALFRHLADTLYGVLVVVHDPNLALRYAHEVTLLCAGSLIAQGLPDSVLSPANVSKAYRVPVTRCTSEGDGVPLLQVETATCVRQSEATASSWIRPSGSA